MPETAIYEKCKFNRRKNEVWFTEEWDVPPPARNLVTAKYFHQAQLRRFIPAALNSGHDVGALRRRKEIRHISKVPA
jgi:hypothetical protein